MMMARSLLESLRISRRSFMHKEQLSFPKDLLQEIGFPCHKILTFTCLRASPAVSFVCQLWKCVAKCLANESKVLLLFTSEHTSFKCWVNRTLSFCCVFPIYIMLHSLHSVLYTTIDFLHFPPNIHSPSILEARLQLQGKSSKSLDFTFLVSFIVRSPMKAWPKFGNL